MSKKKENNFLVQGTILAVAGVLCRLISIVRRIPITRILGSEGMGYYGAAYEAYSILLLLSSYSMPLAISKMVSARVAKNEYKNTYRILQKGMLFALGTGMVATLILFFGADWIADVMKLPPASVALKMLAPALVLLAMLGVLRGFFQGLGTMIPTAVSQILEQIISAGISIVAAYWLFSYGKGQNKKTGEVYWDKAYGAGGATLGVVFGALAALLFLIFAYQAYKGVLRKKMRRDHLKTLESSSDIMRILVLTIVPVILSTTVYNISGFLDSSVFSNIMYYKKVKTEEYASYLGVYTSQYRLLVQLPIAIAASLASSIIPSISASMAERNKKQVLKKIDSSLRFIMIIAMPCAVGLAVLARPILSLLFRDPSTENLAVNMVQLGVISVILYSISTVTNAVLQGIDKMRLPVIHALIALGIHMVALVVLLFTTNTGVYALVLTDILFTLVVCILNAYAMKKYMHYRQEIYHTFVLPAICSVIMGVATRLIYLGCMHVYPSVWLSTMIAIFCAVVIYFVFLLLSGAISEEELQVVPKGNTIIAIAKKCNLLD